MSISDETVERLLAIARDPMLGRTFDERITALASHLDKLIPSAKLNALLFDPARGARGASHVICLGFDTRFLRDYLDYFIQFDPCARHGLTNPGVPHLLGRLVPDRVWGKDPHSADLMEPNDIRYRLACTYKLPDRWFALALSRLRQMGDFTNAESKLFSLALPDVARAAFGIVLDETIAGAAPPARDETVRSAVLLFDEQGDLVHAGPGAVALQGRIAAEAGLAAEAIASVTRELLAAAPAADWHRERTFAVRGGGWLRARFSRLGRPEKAVLVELELLVPGTRDYTQAVAARAGWTERERDAAVLAARGLGNGEIGRDLGIARNTVAVHLRHVYAKAGVSGRTELAALLNGGAYGPARGSP